MPPLLSRGISAARSGVVTCEISTAKTTSAIALYRMANSPVASWSATVNADNRCRFYALFFGLPRRDARGICFDGFGSAVAESGGGFAAGEIAMTRAEMDAALARLGLDVPEKER